MNILILGATGFIGNAIFHKLISKHSITIAGRKPIESYDNFKYIDFFDDNLSNRFEGLIDSIDLVINAIGIISGDFNKIQAELPISLYKLCQENNIKIIHISAIGAEKDNPKTEFLRTKKITDDFLLNYKNAKIIYPGVVIGRNSQSTQFFAEITQFPIIPLLGKNDVPLVHISQLVGLVEKTINQFENQAQQIFAIAEPESMEDYFTALKGKKSIYIQTPKFIFTLLFAIFPKIKIGAFNKNLYTLSQIISVEDYTPIFTKATKEIDRANIIKSDHFPQLFALLSISFIWIWSGISSLISWETSQNIINHITENSQIANSIIISASIIDILIGIIIFNHKYRQITLLISITFILVYMIIISVYLPHYWLDPFGILIKNIPLLMLSYYLYGKWQRS